MHVVVVSYTATLIHVFKLKFKFLKMIHVKLNLYRHVTPFFTISRRNFFLSLKLGTSVRIFF